MGSKPLPDERGSAPLPNAEARDVVGVTGNADVTTADILPLMLMSTRFTADTRCFLVTMMCFVW